MTATRRSAAMVVCVIVAASLLIPGIATANEMETSTFVSLPSGPGEKVISSVMYLWTIAPDKFRPLIREDDWKVLMKRYKMTSKGIEEIVLKYDIAEFDDERARVSESRSGPPDYLVTATKQFDSDDACLTYYDALLERFAVQLAGDRVKQSKRRDHVFFKDERKGLHRKLYIKHHIRQKPPRKPRVVLSIRVTFTTEKFTY